MYIFIYAVFDLIRCLAESLTCELPQKERNNNYIYNYSTVNYSFIHLKM